VARASTVAWMGVVMGVALVPAGVRAQSPRSATTSSSSVPELPAPGAMDPVGAANNSLARPSQVHVALTTAIASYRRGDFELAATYFQQAQAGQTDLTPAERQDLGTWLQLNGTALQARREGANQLRQAEAAMAQNRTQDAATLLRAVSRNQQFLASADKQRLQQLNEQLHPGAGSASSAPTAATLTQARTKLKQARLMLSRGDYVAAQTLAKEADQLGASYQAGEDTPQKLLADIKARSVVQSSDPKKLLEASRTCLKRGDLDEAERLAQAAEKNRSFWSSMQIWSDSPSKVLKDVQAARAARQVAQATAQKAAQADMQKTAQSTIQKTSAKDAPKTVEAYKPVAGQTEVAASTAKGSAPAVDKTASARQLIKDARKALQGNDLAKAKQLTDQARALKPELNWWEDTPDKVLADIRQIESKKPQPAKAKESLAVDGGTPDAHLLMKQARESYDAGKLDEAEKLAMRAGTNKSATWGLFETSPDKLLLEVRKTRAKRDQEESVRVLEQARKLYAAGNLKDAEAQAQRAERLHGPYSLWDLGDRPQKLLADIETAKAKSSANKLPPLPTGIAKKEADKPAPAAAAVVKKEPEKPANSTGIATVSNNSFLPPPVWPTTQEPKPEPKTEAMPRVAENTSRPALPLPPPPALPGAGNHSKEQARLLLLQARQYQKEGRLEEARQKALEAQGLGASYGPEEDRPEVALIGLSALCQKRVDSLVQQANDFTSTAEVDPTRYQRAEANLVQARGLAVAFGFDTQSVDAKLTWLRQVRDKAPAGVAVAQAPAVPAQDQTATAPAPAQHGQTLLSQARMELRAGQTTNARRLAEEAFSPQYGVQTEATQMLRSIDAEERNQKTLSASHSFDAGHGAFLRHDYAQASAMFRTIDPHLLPPDKQTRLKELMLTPQMQPSAIAQASLNTMSSETDATAGKDQAGGPIGTRATPEAEFAHQVQAMQEVKFQKLRADGLQVQSEALKRFQAGDTDQALGMLEEYDASLNDAGLDSDRLAMLRRPIQARLQQYRTLKHQRDFEKLVSNAGHAGDLERSKRAMQEQEKQKQISELMKEYNTLYKEAKYEKAEMLAVRASELDPDDARLSAAIYVAKMQKNATSAKKGKEARETMFVNALNKAEDPGAPVDSDQPLSINADVLKVANGRKPINLLNINKVKSEKESEIYRKLDLPITPMDFKDTPLRLILDDLQGWTGINIVPDEPALAENGISLDRPMNLKLENVALKSALNLLLHQAHLTYVVKDEVLNITTEDHAHGRLETRVHQVADLVIPVEDAQTDTTSLQKALDRGLRNPSLKLNGTSPYEGRNMMTGGANVSQAQTMNSMTSESGMTPVVTKQNAKGTIEENLIRLIQNTIEPRSWASLGGQATIEYYPLGYALVINQTPDIQEQVAELLQALRRLQDQEVTIEVRFITLAESFYERIGIDFNLNIVNNQTRFQPQLVSQQFKPFGFINSFTPNNFVTGLTPAGAGGGTQTTPGLNFTQDLGIPIKASSFQMAVPPFGQFPQIPGANGGVSLGLAFLSDIQVYMFMEAAQGDQRTNVMQAPKLTLFNGQTSTITVADQQFFVTSVTVTQIGGQVVFSPNNTPIATGGVNLTLNAVISADRRFVRMSIAPDLTNIASANVPLFPITTFITPILEGGAVGQPVPFTQFLQQPAFSNVAVNTTVNVPDGGTVLLGGLKRMSEGRNEFGPPVLSKIPYIDRLFKNVGYGRETESLMMMVTPRIIINEEEELRQVPGLPGAGSPP
jgi:type II secretory pathway component GspD/PulD (secretin)